MMAGVEEFSVGAEGLERGNRIQGVAFRVEGLEFGVLG